MRLKVLNVAYPFAPVSSDAVGGAEQVIAAIDEALVRAGHQSMVVAMRGSRVQGTLIQAPPVNGLLTPEVRAEQYQEYRVIIEDAIRSAELVHMHGVDFYEYLPASEIPVLVTLHLPPDLYPEWVYTLERPNTYLHCVSPAQHERCPDSDCLLGPIENGVESVPPAPIRRRDYALSLGRICPEKGFHLAMDAARLAGVRLFLGGNVFPYEAHLDYLEKQIRPREDRLRQWIGPLQRQRKFRALRAARCLLVPSTIPETSSLVSMEALACGTPVIAFRFGALPSLIEHGRTGFLVDSVEEMAQAILRTGEIDPEVCRAVARERFSVERMTQQYLDRYVHIASTGKEKHQPEPAEAILSR